MVFVIQNSQNRDSLAAQIKLDENYPSLSSAKNSMIDLECLTDRELAELHTKFAEIAHIARKDEDKVRTTERESALARRTRMEVNSRQALERR
jgi:low affinity Fe/Cu permease